MNWMQTRPTLNPTDLGQLDQADIMTKVVMAMREMGRRYKSNTGKVRELTDRIPGQPMQKLDAITNLAMDSELDAFMFPPAALTRFDAARKIWKIQQRAQSGMGTVGGKLKSIKRTYVNPRTPFGAIREVKDVSNLDSMGRYIGGTGMTGSRAPASELVRTPRARLKGEKSAKHIDAKVAFVDQFAESKQSSEFLQRPSGRPMTLKELHAQAKPDIPRVTESRRLREVPLAKSQRRSKIEISKGMTQPDIRDTFTHEFGHELHLGLSDMLAPGQRDVLNKAFREGYIPHASIDNPRELFAWAYEDYDKFLRGGSRKWREYPKEVRDLVKSVKATADLRPTQGFAAHAAREKQLLKGRKLKRTP